MHNDEQRSKLSDEERAELDAFDAELFRERRNSLQSRALSRELLWLLLFDILQVLLALVGVMFQVMADWVSQVLLYSFIVGLAVAGFGVWRSSFGWKWPEHGKIFVLYGLFFSMAFVFYAVLMGSLIFVSHQR